MMMKNKLSRVTASVLSAVLAVLCVISYVPVKANAATLAQQKAEYSKKIAAAESELAQMRKEKASQDAIAKKLQSQLAVLSSQISVIQSQQDEIDRKVNSLTEQINTLTDEIAQTEKELEQKNKNIDETVDTFCVRMRSNYMSGPTSILDILLKSEDFSSMLNQIELMKRVTDNDQKLVDRLNKEIEEAKALKAQLTQDKEDAEIKKNELGAKKIELDATKAEYNQTVTEVESKAAEVDKILNGMNADIEELNDDIADFKAAESEISAAIRKAEAAEAARRAAEEAARRTTKKNSSGGSSGSSGGYSGGSYSGGGTSYIPGNISSSGWMWPVPTGASYISSTYGYRRDPATGASKFHGGLDIAAPAGSNIVATRAGTVVYVKYGNSGYGNHVLLSHGDGSYSLYGHCLSNLEVSTGQHVSQGQVIAHVGMSGYATGYHCHFEIRTGPSMNDRINPMNFVHK